MNKNIRFWVGAVILIGIVIAVITYARYQPVVSSNTASTTSSVVYGMNQYTDAHGFSFWYPNALTINSSSTQDSTSFPGGAVVETLHIGSAGGVSIFVVDSPSSSITDEANNHASPIAQTKYFYDFVAKQWMVAYPEGTNNGGTSATTTANISKTTVGGLIMLPSGRRFDTTIIPLSTTRFIVVSDGGGSSFTSQLAQTVTQVSTHIENSQWDSVLQAEATAFSGDQSSQNTTQPVVAYTSL